ncbi:MAG TPA: hypothetical protein VMJ10_14025 [Kofleriaceae bacterium]|nr:hypothetical protein [Kofleriaceae bacterium]
MIRRACIAVALAACGTDFETGPTPDVLEQSGSRLMIEWWETTDGAMQLRGVFDSKLGVECAFEPMSGTDYACVDAGVGGDYVHATVELAGQGRLVTRMLRASDGLVLPYGFDDAVNGPCEPTALPGTNRFVCAPPAAAPTDDDPDVSLAIDFGDGHRLERRYWTTIEGLRQHDGTFWDTELAIECAMTAQSGLPDAYCTPPMATARGDYALGFPTVDR